MLLGLCDIRKALNCNNLPQYCDVTKLFCISITKIIYHRWGDIRCVCERSMHHTSYAIGIQNLQTWHKKNFTLPIIVSRQSCASIANVDYAMKIRINDVVQLVWRVIRK